MKLFVLIVEDEVEWLEELRQALAELAGTTAVHVANSRETAFAYLDNEFFDLILLDLKIPTIDGSLDADPAHGHAVFARARARAPGTPIFVFTGSPAEDFIPAMLQQQQQVDIWGKGRKTGSIEFLKKIKFDELPGKLVRIAASVHALSDVELDRGGIDLTIQEDRLIRIFAKRFDGTHCAVSRLGGGLSGAKVYRLRVKDAGGACIHDAVAKLGSPEEIRDEATRFDDYVCRLDPGVTPRKLATLDFGAGAVAGVFYGLAGTFDASAFNAAFEQGGRAAAVIGRIERAISPWSAGVPQTRRTIAVLRQRVLSDEAANRVIDFYGLEWARSFEAINIQTRWACIHGDLHGNNVLVSADGSIALIDYGDVGVGSVSLDPITLELSLIFHPQKPALHGWPTLDQARQWGSLDSYLVGCPVSEFVSACRAWSDHIAAGQREVAAAAYSYLLRQLKYRDTNKELVLALLSGVKRHYDET